MEDDSGIVMTGDEGDSERRLADRLIEDARAEGYAAGKAAAGTRYPMALMADELRMMPSVLVDAYAALCAAALSDGGGGERAIELRVLPKTRLWRTDTNREQTRGVAKASKQKGSHGGPDVKSARLLALKTSIDRKLRKIARQIDSDLAGGTREPPRKCTRCGKYGEDDWNWCPRDGAPMQSEDQR